MTQEERTKQEPEVTYGMTYNRYKFDRCKIRVGSDLRHDVRQIYIYIYRKFTANSSMWGSLRLAPIKTITNTLEITRDYWRLLGSTGNYWRLLGITRDYMEHCC